MAHSRLAPSKSQRVILCPASPDREAALTPRPAGDAANLGSNAHFVAEHAIQEMTWPPTVLQLGTSEFEAALPYPELKLPIEYELMAEEFYEYVKRRSESEKQVAVRAESEVSPRLFTDRTDSDGTADAILVANMWIEVADLKTGGTLVEPDAPQLKLYALGALAEYYNAETNSFPFEKVILTVFQPLRPDEDKTERSAEFTPEELVQWAREVWVPAAAASDDPNAVGRPSEEACKYCECRKQATCPEHKAFVEGQAQLLFDPVQDTDMNPPATLEMGFDINQLTPEQIGLFLDAWPLMKARAKDIEEHAASLMKDRVVIPGWKLVRGKSSRAWTEDDEEMAKKFKNMKIKLDVAQPRNLLTAPQAMNSPDINTKQKELLKKYIKKQDGSLSLAPESDKRLNAMPAVEFQPVQEVKPEEQATAQQLPDFLALPDFLQL